MTDDDAYAQWDAAYVLGALSPDERRAYERHLATCPSCRAAVGELAGMPAVLAELRADQAVALTAPDESDGGTPGADVVPLGDLAAAAARRTRRRRAWQVAAAAALVVVGGAGGALAVHAAGGGAPPSAGEAPEATTVTLLPVDDSRVEADLSLTASSWGTRLAWSCSYPDLGGPPPADVVYELVLVDGDGERSVVATWSGDGEQHASGLLASSAIPLDDITRIELGVGDDLVLAAAELTDV